MPNREEVSVGDGTNSYDLSTLTTHEDGSEYQIRIEGTPGSAVSVNSVELTGFVSVTETGLFVQASGTPFITEKTIANVSINDLTAAGSPFITEKTIANTSLSEIQASASTLSVSETAKASESQLFINADASTLSVDDTAVANESLTLTISATPLTISEVIRATRSATTEGDGEADTSAELSDVFPSQSSADLDFTLVNDPVLGFASEWVHEESQFEDPSAFTFLLDVVLEKGFTVRLQYDQNGNGDADYTTEPVSIDHDEQPVTFKELGDEGYYRMIISDMRPSDYLRALVWGPTRY